jgi:hypothetical protein
MSMPMSRDNSTPTKCGRLPAADVAYDAFVGFAFAHATNSAHVFAPLPGPAASANWNVAPSPIAVKSLTGSYGIAFSVCGTTAIGPMGITMIVEPSGAAALTASRRSDPRRPACSRQ